MIWVEPLYIYLGMLEVLPMSNQMVEYKYAQPKKSISISTDK